MTTWITSDIHLNHLNILKYCPHRSCGREVSWDTVAMMNEKIIKNWNVMVEPEDDVYILGDVAMGQIEKAPNLIRRLNGNKSLIKGNHDKTLYKNMCTDNPDFQDLFDYVGDVLEFGYKTENGKKVSLFMSHYPHHSWNGMNQGAIHFHGHLHGSSHNITGRIMDVGMDTNNLYPYRLEDAVQRMMKIDIIRTHHGD